MSKAIAISGDVDDVMAKISAMPPDALDDGLLDEAVHSAASQEACEANNGGVRSQIVYLLEHGYAVADVMFLLNEMAGVAEKSS